MKQRTVAKITCFARCTKKTKQDFLSAMESGARFLMVRPSLECAASGIVLRSRAGLPAADCATSEGCRSHQERARGGLRRSDLGREYAEIRSKWVGDDQVLAGGGLQGLARVAHVGIGAETAKSLHIEVRLQVVVVVIGACGSSKLRTSAISMTWELARWEMFG